MGTKRGWSTTFLRFLFLYSDTLVHLLLEECALKSKHVTKFNFFTTEYIRACDALVNIRFNYQLKIFTIPNLKRLNNKSFYRILLLLSDDISLNPGPKNNLHPLNLNVWNVFISKGPQLLLKYQQPSSANWWSAIYRQQLLWCSSKSKLDESPLQWKIQINKYNLLHRGRNRNGGGAAC